MLHMGTWIRQLTVLSLEIISGRVTGDIRQKTDMFI